MCFLVMTNCHTANVPLLECATMAEILLSNDILSVLRKETTFGIMKNAEKKEVARGLYVKSTFTRKEIALHVGVTEKTLRNWIEEGNWDAMRDSLQITRPQLLKDAYAQLNAINRHIEEKLNNIPTKEFSDSKAVIRKEIEAFSTQPIHKYIEVFEESIDFLSKNHPSKIAEFAEWSQEFINQLSKK